MAENTQNNEKFGRIAYFDPVVEFYENRAGTWSDSITFPYEDYSIAVDLIVREYNRYSCGFSNVSGEFKDYRYSTSDGTISFLAGSNISDAQVEPGADRDVNGRKYNYLTTNYTDVSMIEPKDNTAECLGIQSINITYQSWFHPQVTIKFVDVRGATVMLQAENAYYNPDELGRNSHIYKSFFSFPYPLFLLKVKGFYGKGVTYRLAINKTTIEFDADTGDFIITADFIGHMYGIFADIPMTFLGIAPYTEEGSLYWDEKIADETFCFRGPNGEIQAPMMKFPRLKETIARAIASFDVVQIEAEGAETEENIDSESESITAIMNQYITVFGNDQCFESDNHPGVIYRMGSGMEDPSQYKKDVEAFFDAVSAHDATYATNFYSQLGGYSIKNDIKHHKRNRIQFVYDKKDRDKTTEYYPTLSESDLQSYNLYKEYIEGSKDVTDKIDAMTHGLTNFTVYVFKKGTNEKFEDIVFSGMTSYKTNLNQRKIDKKEEYKKKKEAALEKALGFTPSIRNFYELAFAHMDTFLEVFYIKMKKIKEQLDGKTYHRQKTHYPEVTDEMTDTEHRKNRKGDDIDLPRAHYLPPFTAYYKENRDTTLTDTNGNVQKNVLRWPGELVNSSDLEEVGYIDEMLAASQMYTEDNKIVDGIIATLSGKTVNIEAPTSDVLRFIPMTTYDISHNGRFENPYNSLKRGVLNNSEDIEGKILLKFALRAFYYLSTNDNDGNDNNDDYSFGRIEAVNFYKAMGEVTSKKFFELLKKYADGKHQSSEQSDFIRYITTTKKIEGITDVWLDDTSANAGRALFSKSGGMLKYHYYKGDKSSGSKFTYFPIKETSDTRLKADVVKGDSLLRNTTYISTTNMKGYSGNPLTFQKNNCEPLQGGSFFVIDDGKFLAQLTTNFENSIKIAEEHFKTRKENGAGYGSAEITDFTGIRRRDFRRYSDNFKQDSDDNYYDKYSVTDGSGSHVGRRTMRKLTDATEEININDYYIKYPTEVNDKVSNSLYECPMYYLQNNIVAKACLFMQAVPLLGDGNTGAIDEESINGVTSKTVLLREGALYWFEKNKDDENKLVFSGRYNGRYYRYQKPYNGHWLGRNLAGAGPDTCETMNPTEGLFEHDGGYFSYRIPKNATESRKTYLEQYFINWAQTEYSRLEPLLMDKNLYKDGDYSKGLDVESVANSKASNDTGVRGKELQKKLRGLFLQMCTTFDYYNGCYDKKEMKCEVRRMEDAFNGFCDELRNIYGDFADDLKNDQDEANRKLAKGKLENPFDNDDLRLSTYMTMKSLYDKWLSGCYHGEETYRFRRKEGTVYEIDNFLYCDNFFHDIGYRLLVNVTKVGEWLNNLMPSSELVGEEPKVSFKSKSIYEFLADIAELVGAYLMAIPQRMMYTDKQSIASAFKPIPSCLDWDEDTSTYMVLYPYKPSEHLGSEDMPNIDMNGWSPEGDGFDLTNEDIQGRLFTDDGSVVPAFGVTFAKQNQSYFKNIKLSSATQGLTEVAIANTMNIASKSGEEVRQTTLFGQDIYKVYSNYAYECTVEMMGCMQIFPPMYFQLNNVPMWKGAYMIQKVEHNIEPGNITTTFTGVRQNKYTIPMTNSDILGFVGKDGQPNPENPGPAGAVTSNGVASNETINATDTNVTDSNVNISELNVGSVQETQIKGDRNKVLNNVDESDFNPANVTKTKPLICLTAAHGPNTGKKEEWAWSTKLIDNYIVPKLKRLNFTDGTSFAENIHRCNVGGKNTSSGGYSGREIQAMVTKYGSDCVISVVPHWNGGAAKYHCVFDGKQIGTWYDTGKVRNGKPVYWWKDPRNPRIRKDSAIFAEYMKAEVRKVVAKKDTFQKMPLNMMDQGLNGTHLLYTKSYQGDNTDPALNPDCACLLTENWFADYKPESGGISWVASNYNEIGANGRYCNGRAWLESDEGCNAIADMHVSAIYNYIKSLQA